IFLRTGHAPLNKHLHHIRKSDSPSCPHCPGVNETVHHYLLECLHFRHDCHTLIGALGRRATSLQFLLMDSDATPHLVSFVNRTKRFKTTLGEV
ncbi:uncharacterized protein BJ212DRAFT_1250973, partial [Suillus subaureus]